MLNRSLAPLALLCCLVSFAPAGEIIVNPATPIGASSIDQPELSAIAYGPGGLITDSSGSPIVFDVFVDTGASGFVISSLTARGYTMTDLFGGAVVVPGLGLDGTPAGEFIGTFTETGIGGQEPGDVTWSIGIRVRNGSPLEGGIDLGGLGLTMPAVDVAEFADYGGFNLWVRQDAGYGERITLGGDLGLNLELVDPLNVVGMPVIGQGVMVLDPTPMSEAGRLQTYLLPKGSPTPATNMTFNLALRDFTGSAPLGEVLPSHAANPVFENVTLAHTSGDVRSASEGNTLLFDTGAGASFISFAKAKAVGLIDPQYDELSFQQYLVAHVQAGLPVQYVGGIGSLDEPVQVPMLRLDELIIPDAAGNTIVWRDIDLLILDVQTPPGTPGLDGVFGMNLLLPSITLNLGDIGSFDPDDLLANLDLAELLALLLDPSAINPGYFDAIVFQTTGVDSAELRLSYIPEPATAAMLALAGLSLIRRRRAAARRRPGGAATSQPGA